MFENFKTCFASVVTCVFKSLKCFFLPSSEFLKFVVNQEECRKKWLQAESELPRLRQEVAKSKVGMKFPRLNRPLKLDFISLTVSSYGSKKHSIICQILLFQAEIEALEVKLKHARYTILIFKNLGTSY